MIGRLGGYGTTGFGYLFGLQPPAFQGIQLVIAGESILTFDQFALSGSDELGERGSLDIVIYDQTAGSQIQIGSRVRVLWDGKLKWSGFVETVSSREMGHSGTLETNISCVGNNALADRHLVSAVFQSGMKLGAVVAEILNVQSGDAGERLVDDGVEIDGDSVDDGPELEEVRFNRATVHEALDKLCELADYWWTIDHRLVLWVKSRADRSAPYPLDPSVWKGYAALNVSSELGSYRNVQTLESGKIKTQAQEVEIDVGNGENRTFETALPLASKPKIEISRGGGAYSEIAGADIGVQEKDVEKKWYYRVGENLINQSSDETVLGGTDKVRITYYGLFEAATEARDSEEILRMRRVSGTSGAIHDVERDDAIQDQALAEERAFALLRRYGKVLPEVTYTTYDEGFEPGQIQVVNVPEHQLVGDALITEVKWELVSEQEKVFRYKIKATMGNFVGGWADYYRRLAAHGRPLRFGENEKINVLRTQRDAVTWADNLSPDLPLPPEAVDNVSVLSVGSPWVGWEREEVLDPLGVIIFPGQDNRLIMTGPRVGPADYPEGSS